MDSELLLKSALPDCCPLQVATLALGVRCKTSQQNSGLGFLAYLEVQGTFIPGSNCTVP